MTSKSHYAKILEKTLHVDFDANIVKEAIAKHNLTFSSYELDLLKIDSEYMTLCDTLKPIISSLNSIEHILNKIEFNGITYKCHDNIICTEQLTNKNLKKYTFLDKNVTDESIKEFLKKITGTCKIITHDKTIYGRFVVSEKGKARTDANSYVEVSQKIITNLTFDENVVNPKLYYVYDTVHIEHARCYNMVDGCFVLSAYDDMYDYSGGAKIQHIKQYILQKKDFTVYYNDKHVKRIEKDKKTYHFDEKNKFTKVTNEK